MKEVKLKFPFDFEGQRIDRITIRPAKLREVKEAEERFGKEGLQRSIYLLSKVSGLPIEAIEQMTEPDFLKVMEEYNDFFN